ncbi:hypothetical protein M758_1G256200 [Ceratodon purpureus]|nr:hypothetical protein M758_1G256200 [Ceratodon purpureus]
MAYTIKARVIQSDPNNSFSIVEKTCCSTGYWTERDGTEHTLTMEKSGASSMLRFKNSDGYFFLVALGVHNYKRWCDIVDNTDDTGLMVNQSY